jgi:YHS domain-containing protein
MANDIEVRSPATGIVLARNVSPMQRFEKGTELFRIANIDRVWILSDVFEREARHIHPGTKVKVSLPHQDKVFEANVSDVPPQFDPATRSFKLRLEADNSDLTLRPDMFVDVEFLVSLPPAFTVPAEAVLDTGLRKTVFVDIGNGRFEPRTVETGWRFGDRVEIVSGIMPGERIVISGNFLIDSESRMKLAAAGMHGTPGKDPTCGMEVYSGPAKAAGLFADHGGHRYHFCCEQCKSEFEKAPERYTKQPPGEKGAGGDHAARKAEETREGATDPVCGMRVEAHKAKACGLSAAYQGKTYYFVNEDCKKRFEAEPQRYSAKAATGGMPSTHPMDPASSLHADHGSSTGRPPEQSH